MGKIALLLLFALTSCTYSITTAQTQGRAKDVIDETTSNAPTVSPDISVPVSLTP